MIDPEKPTKFEKEIYKQLDQFDETVERSGWFYIVLVTGILFIIIGSFMYLSKTSPNSAQTIDEMNQQINLLEERIEILEEKVADQK